MAQSPCESGGRSFPQDCGRFARGGRDSDRKGPRSMIQELGDHLYVFRVYLPHASQVELVGDFTEWRTAPVRMSLGRDGWWSVQVRLPGGVQRFSYLVDGCAWLPDYSAHGLERNSYGGFVSRVDTGQRPARRARTANGTPAREDMDEGRSRPVEAAKTRAPAVGAAAAPRQDAAA
ncbi:MAG: hypothetical protein EA376_13650 [Phycisphaeraceae bacterium]|nr:MAG: hypothetical protein EA376_13650 [Phycisphaeraceae bacterium]